MLFGPQNALTSLVLLALIRSAVGGPPSPQGRRLSAALSLGEREKIRPGGRSLGEGIHNRGREQPAKSNLRLFAAVVLRFAFFGPHPIRRWRTTFSPGEKAKRGPLPRGEGKDSPRWAKLG